MKIKKRNVALMLSFPKLHLMLANRQAKLEASIRSLIDAGHIYIVSTSDIMGGVACWAVRQSPYPVPDNLETVLNKLNIIMGSDNTFKEPSPDFRYSKFDFRDLEAYIKSKLETIPEFTDWNNRKNKDNKSEYNFVTRYNVSDPDNDFIDLGALYKNVTGLILTDAEEFRIFNEEFDKEQKEIEEQKENPLEGNNKILVNMVAKILKSQASSDIPIEISKNTLPIKDWKKVSELHDIDKTIKYWIKVLKKYGYKYEGQTPGTFSSHKFTKKGKSYRIKDYDLWVDPFDCTIILEEIYF